MITEVIITDVIITIKQILAWVPPPPHRRVCLRASLVIIAVAAMALLFSACAHRAGAAPSDPLNTTYLIEGKPIHLRDGRAEAPAAPGSAARVRTVVLGAPVYGDLTGDGEADAALILVQDSGGSGTFYYVAAALRMGVSYRGTNTARLGDRVAIHDLRIRNGVVIVDYADRRTSEPMSAEPTVDESRDFVLRDGKLREAPGDG